MVFETIIVGFACIAIAVILSVGGIIGIGTWKTISLGLAEIGEAGKNTRERINVRADMGEYSEDGVADETAEVSELDSLARMLGYDSVMSAMSDPALMSKLGLGKKKIEGDGE